MRWAVRTEYVNAWANEVVNEVREYAVEYVTDSTPEHGWERLRPVSWEA